MKNLITGHRVIPNDELYSVSRKTISDLSGVIEAPGWPDENYPNSADCMWIIQVDAVTYSQGNGNLLPSVWRMGKK